MGHWAIYLLTYMSNKADLITKVGHCLDILGTTSYRLFD